MGLTVPRMKFLVLGIRLLRVESLSIGFLEMRGVLEFSWVFTSQSSESSGAPTTCQALCWAPGMQWRMGRWGPCTHQADSSVMETDIRRTVLLVSPSLDTVAQRAEQPCQPTALGPEQIQNALISALGHKDNEERAQQFSAPRPTTRLG